MSKGFLLDTNVVSEPLRSIPDSGVLRKLQLHRERLAIATPVWHELFFGARLLEPSRRRRDLERYLEEVVSRTLPVLPYDRAAAQWHAQERARLCREGRPPSFVDGQIAAIARVNDLILVTANVTHFAPFGDLQVQDWRSGAGHRSPP